MATIPSAGGGGAGGSGWVKIVDVDVPGGVALDKVFQDAPNNTILQSAKVSALDIEVSVKASYPVVDVNGNIVTLPPSSDEGHYEGTVPVTISGTGPFAVTVQTANNVPGAVDACDFTVELPPVITDLSFSGTYPGSQTELKEGDNFTIVGATDKYIDRVRVLDYGACQLEEFSVPPDTAFSVAATIADRGNVATLRPARVQVRDVDTGAWSDTRDTNQLGGTVNGFDLVNCNNLHPTVVWGTVVSYPGSQQALKGAEYATVDIATANLDSILVDSPTGELTIAFPTSDETPRQAWRASGDYNVSTPNIRATATRNANGAVTSASTIINIANVAPTINVVTPAARLRSGGNDGTAAQNHTITIQSNQQLLSVAMDAGASGTFLGAWAGGPSNWTRALQVHDNDAKGAFTFQNLVATGLAGIVQNTINSGAGYTLGGFVSRTLTFAAFATQTPMNVMVIDFSKLSAGIFTATNQPALKQAISTPPSVTNGYTIDATGVKPTQVIWLDTPAAGSNSSGTAQITNVQEAV